MVKEHYWHLHHEHRDGSAMAEDSVNSGHSIQLQDTRILSTKSQYIDYIIIEVTEIELHPNTMNREDGFYLSHGKFSSSS
jgi:hypothetical protein